MDIIANFKKLQTVSLCGQGISQIEGLSGLQQLEKLWLNDNEITKIKGISKCVNLKCLYITGNKISKIEGLDKLKKIEVLWLAENNISVIQGIKNLTQLKDLNLAGNKISSLGNSLDPLLSLEELNLSNNKIGNLKELLNLNRLPKLRVASFSDPHYGENPICGLCNYQTYALYHLPKLEILDMSETSDDAKALAEATFMKKRMFYNMKIKTMQRVASNVIKSIKACERIKRFKINKEIDYLTQELKLCIKNLEEEKAGLCMKNPNSTQLEDKKTIIHGKIYDKYEEINYLESTCSELKKKCYDVSENNINKLITELETGGNIRFEEGKASDKWYKSCTELMKTRYNPEHLKEFGEFNINVTRVTKIHNRYLRNLFEEKLEQLIDICDKNLKKSLDYLFCEIDPHNFTEASKIIEEGFKCNNQNPVGLCNTVTLAELPRLYQTMEKPHSKLRKPTNGTILMCKVYISNPIVDSPNDTFDPKMSPSEILREKPAMENMNGNCVFRSSNKDMNQKLWIFFDSAIILPEYVVEFEYLPSITSILYSPSTEIQTEFDSLASQLYAARQTVSASYQQMMGGKNGAAISEYGSINCVELDRADLGCLKGSLVELMKSCDLPTVIKTGLQFTVSAELSKQINELQPKIEQMTRWDSIIPSNLDLYSLGKLADLQYLNLINAGITIIENLSNLVNLKVLVLSFNTINKIQGLEDNLNLERLELSYNQIAKIENMETLAKLKILEINNNYIQNFSDLNHLKNNNPALEELSIRSNPFTSSRNYKPRVLSILPNLKKIDGFSVMEKDKEILTKAQNIEISKGLVMAGSKFSISAIHDSSIMFDQDTAQLSPGKRKVISENWEQYVIELNLSHQKIDKITLLNAFTGVRILNLSDNKITKIEGLEGCKMLEELNLEKNKITQTEGLSTLLNLRKLDLGKNKIQTITGIDSLENLVQLSIEDNIIQSLSGFPIMLKNLMELYIGNNTISDFREIQILKQLPKLIILDISGNKACEDPHYRLYIIFHLKKLKVLDGLSIEQVELNESRNTYAGRLTEEVLLPRLYGKSAKNITELDLSGSKLRDFDDMFNENNFPALQELNLSNNYFGSLKAIGHMSKLKVLIISQNKIETLYTKPDEKGAKRGLFAIPVFFCETFLYRIWKYLMQALIIYMNYMDFRLRRSEN